MLNEVRIKCFLNAAKSLNFTETSKQLFISQQAVSKHIAELEQDVGVRLFVRDHHHASLTPEGEKIYAYLSEASVSWERLMKEVHSSAPANRVQSIRIGYQNWMDFGAAPRHAMHKLKSKYPDLNLIGERHSPSGLLDLLDKKTLDIVLMHKRFLPKKAELTILPLFDTPMLIVVAEDNPLNSGDPNWEAFRDEPLLMDQLEGETEENTVRRARREAKQYGFTPERVIVLPNRDSIYTEAEIGRGVFFGSGMTQTPKGMRLVSYETGHADTICCVRRKANRKRRVRDFAEQLQAEYAE
jgi:DNA-binding transcriptional LysR family regulator